MGIAVLLLWFLLGAIAVYNEIELKRAITIREFVQIIVCIFLGGITFVLAIYIWYEEHKDDILFKIDKDET